MAKIINSGKIEISGKNKNNYCILNKILYIYNNI